MILGPYRPLGITSFHPNHDHMIELRQLPSDNSITGSVSGTLDFYIVYLNVFGVVCLSGKRCRNNRETGRNCRIKIEIREVRQNWRNMAARWRQIRDINI